MLVLAFVWGSAFLLTKIAVTGLPPLVVVAGRLTIAATILVGVGLHLRVRLLPSARHGLFFLAMSTLGNSLPFSLISWGQQSIPSGLAGMLMACMPLFTIVLAHFLVPGERLSGARIMGFLLGLAGVLLLLGPERLLEFRTSGPELMAELAVLAGAVCYSGAMILARLRPPCESIVASAGTMTAASLVMVPVALFTSDIGIIRLEPVPWLAVSVLGVVCTALATLAYFRLVTRAGPGFLSLINYLIPVWASLLGMWVLGERLALQAWAGLALILGGMLLSQMAARRMRRG